MNHDNVSRLRDNWLSIQTAVRDAAQRAGRDPQGITIVGVTKYVDASTTAALFGSGCNDLGESRPQVLWQKVDAIQNMSGSYKDIRWHMIGHLQRNKIRRTLPSVYRIHSIDSFRLLQAISDQGVSQNKPVQGLLEINLTDEPNKTGLDPNDAEKLLLQSIELPAVQIHGLMAMASEKSDLNLAQKQFASVRRLRDKLRQATELGLEELSMGMSRDFCQAISEGATIVRIGSRLFDGITRDQPNAE